MNIIQRIQQEYDALRKTYGPRRSREIMARRYRFTAMVIINRVCWD